MTDKLCALIKEWQKCPVLFIALIGLASLGPLYWFVVRINARVATTETHVMWIRETMAAQQQHTAQLPPTYPLLPMAN